MCGNKTTFTSDAGFRISYPRPWRSESPTRRSSPVKVYIYPTTASAIDAVDVAASDLDRDMTLDAFTNSNLEELASFRDYTLLSSEDIYAAGHPARKITWQATVPVLLETIEGESRVAQLKAVQIFVIRGTTGYVISYKASPKDFDKYLTQAQEVIDSFAFT